MFFIVNILSSKTNVIIPKAWVFGIENQWEQLVNNGIRRNEQFVCFYSEQQHVFDDQGRPNEEYIPKWEDFLWVKKQFPEQRCYLANILHSTSE